jgi:pimeloyl-ACP methyl ester carboxylesterase
MQTGEIKAVGKLAADALAGPGAIARDVHGAVAGRVFGALGLIGLPVRLMHDGIARASYGAVRAGLRVLPLAEARGIARIAPPDARSMSDSPGGSFALGALNGAIGDTLVTRNRELALELAVRSRGRPVVTDSPGLAAAFPEAGPKLAVFLHGLCETENAWRLGYPRSRSYGSRLRDELGYTPVYVRYNSGLHVSDNGRRLAEVLEHVVRGWPVEVEEIALVGHSMGGLVARSACHYGAGAKSSWTDRVRHVLCLGTPHLGAPLERAANAAGWTLGRLPETQAFAEVVNGRSAGIKDLRYGACLEDDWCDCDPDEFLSDRCHEFPFLSTATYYFVGATLARNADSPFGRIVGDLLVQFASASGSGPRRRIPFEADCGCHVGGVNHIQLLNHPAVYERLHAWLSSPRRAPAILSD